MPWVLEILSNSSVLSKKSEKFVYVICEKDIKYLPSLENVYKK